MENEGLVYISSACRTAIGRLNGQFRDISAATLGEIAINNAMMRCDMTFKDIDSVYMGQGFSCGLDNSQDEDILLKPYLSNNITYNAFNLVTGCSMHAIKQAYEEVMYSLTPNPLNVVCGGQDNISRIHNNIVKTYENFRKIQATPFKYYYTYNGQTRELECSKKRMTECAYPKELVDQIVFKSRFRASEANQLGFFENEIVPVYSKKYPLTYQKDEYLDVLKYYETLPLANEISTEKHPSGYTSLLGDGAAALVLSNHKSVSKKSIVPLGLIANVTEISNIVPRSMAAILAFKNMLDKTGWRMDQIDLYEISEDNALYVTNFMKWFKLDTRIININGGALGLGNTIGANGARLLTTMLYNLERLHKRRGVILQSVGNITYVIAVEKHWWTTRC